MRFKDKDEFSKITLGESYNKNYEFLFENKIENNEINVFNSVPIFKYKELIIKYDKMPTQEEVKKEIQRYMSKINLSDSYRVFSIKGNCVKSHNNKEKEYVVKVAFINFNLNK